MACQIITILHEICHLKRFKYAGRKYMENNTPKNIYANFIEYPCEEMGEFFE